MRRHPSPQFLIEVGTICRDSNGCRCRGKLRHRWLIHTHRNKVQDQLLKGLIGLGLPTGNLVLLMVPGQIGIQHRGRCPC